jgi:hypothetical protein
MSLKELSLSYATGLVNVHKTAVIYQTFLETLAMVYKRGLTTSVAAVIL